MRFRRTFRLCLTIWKWWNYLHDSVMHLPLLHEWWTRMLLPLFAFIFQSDNLPSWCSTNRIRSPFSVLCTLMLPLFPTNPNSSVRRIHATPDSTVRSSSFSLSNDAASVNRALAIDWIVRAFLSVTETHKRSWKWKKCARAAAVSHCERTLDPCIWNTT